MLFIAASGKPSRRAESCSTSIASFPEKLSFQRSQPSLTTGPTFGVLVASVWMRARLTSSLRSDSRSRVVGRSALETTPSMTSSACAIRPSRSRTFTSARASAHS